MTTQIAVPGKDTLTTLRGLVQGTYPITQEHLDRLAKVLGRQDYTSSLSNRMAVAGFHWSVTAENLIKGFRYAATLSTDSSGNLVTVVDERGGTISSIRFTGFVPTFALDKICQAQSAKLSAFTIHSNQPLPVEEVMVNNDPVVIGWEWSRYPEIKTKDRETFFTTNEGVRGFFITGWNLEQELQLPLPT